MHILEYEIQRQCGFFMKLCFDGKCKSHNLINGGGLSQVFEPHLPMLWDYSFLCVQELLLEASRGFMVFKGFKLGQSHAKQTHPTHCTITTAPDILFLKVFLHQQQ